MQLFVIAQVYGLPAVLSADVVCTENTRLRHQVPLSSANEISVEKESFNPIASWNSW